MNPAAAQNFQERWSIIPKANAAEPTGRLSRSRKRNLRREPRRPSPPASSASSARAEDRSATRSVKRGFSGKASYYSYQTGKTASGSSFNRNLLTAAHRSLPFGTRVRVTDLATRKSVIVTITDRGPRAPDRVLDLSLGAARSLGITDRGVVHVRARGALVCARRPFHPREVHQRAFGRPQACEGILRALPERAISDRGRKLA